MPAVAEARKESRSMNRRASAMVGALAVAALVLVPTALATHTPPVSRAYFAEAKGSQLDYSGSATSGIRIFTSGRITAYTRIIDMSPGQVWSVRLYDLGTCGTPRHLVATLDDIRIGGSGVGSRTSAFDATERRLLLDALARGRSVYLRIAHGSRVACAKFARVSPDTFEPRRPYPVEPSFEPTAPIVTPNPFPTFSPPAPSGGS